MNVVAVEQALRRFIARHRAVFSGLGNRQSQTLELGALITVVRHYELRGYQASAENLQGSRTFRVRLSTNGYLDNFSFYRVSRGSDVFDIYGNLPVAGAHHALDGAVYVVDVAVVPGYSVPAGTSLTWFLPHGQLTTFSEVKRLVVYPMLLAQFVGIVHELLPGFLDGTMPDRTFLRERHPVPSLMSVGYVHARSISIVAGHQIRGFTFKVVPNLDGQIASWSGAGQFNCPLC